MECSITKGLDALAAVGADRHPRQRQVARPLLNSSIMNAEGAQLMCGRFTLATPTKQVVDLFSILESPELKPRFNIAPTQTIAVVGQKADGARGLTMMRWGLIPHWANDAKGFAPINARSETLLDKPMFREPFRRRRCLIPADGFYEWKKVGKTKKPSHFRRPDRKPFAFAGIWDRWGGPDGVVLSCCILTTNANELVKPFHDRMPVILPVTSFDHWLDAKSSAEDLVSLLQPAPEGELEAVAVVPLVNSVRNEGPELLEPAA